ncbi:MAG: disulfide bond formation protein B [Rhodospirillales bacterium]|nr:disulfide bond formation protein B [Rhodospirillales bacterium]
MILSSSRQAALFLLLLSVLALGIALGSERWGGLVPCALCLLERWPYRILIALSVVALMLPVRAGRWVLALAVPVLLAGAVLGVIHVGVEQGAWPSPLPECAAPHITGTTIAERLAQMPARPSKPCDDPTYLIPFLPISMAAMNLIAAAGGAVLLGGFLWRSRKGIRR